MVEAAIRSTDDGAFLDLRFKAARLVASRIDSLPATIGKQPQQVQIGVETTSGFTLGLDDPIKPSEMLIEIDYKVILKVQGTGLQLAVYEAKHAAQFSVVRWIGYSDWTNPPSSITMPYLTFVHSMAARRAEQTFLDMGLQGVALPRPSTFETRSALPNQIASDEAKGS